MKKKRVVFIDRDGVINVDPIGDYVKRWEDFQFHEGVPENLKRLADAGYKIILISNQAGVGDGVFPEERHWDLHEKMIDALKKQGIKLYASYFCLHGKNEGCECRKPKAGLFRLAAEKGLVFEKGETYFIGDKATDVEAGKNFGLRTILVRTGHGRKDEPLCRGRLQPDATVDRFEEAVNYLLCES